MKRLLVIPAIAALALSGCFIVGKSRTNSSSQQSSSDPQYKNRGQERKAEVHERNAERKAEKDAEKAEKKDKK